MPLEDMAIFQNLQSALKFNNRRTAVIGQNIAHADTPGYVPSDIAGGDFAKAMRQAKAGGGAGAGQVTLKQTQPGHMSGPKTPSNQVWTVSASPDTETTLNGNAVVLEEQAAKLAEARMGYDAAIGLYQKTLGMLRLAVRGSA